MANALEYPLVNGFRHGFTSITLIFKTGEKDVEMFIKSINYGRTRSRGLVEGNAVDPYGKTRGTNAYKGSVEMAFAEYRLLLDTLGPGYGDKIFSVQVTYGEDGFDTITDELLGCSIDDQDDSNGQGPDPLMRKLDLGPLKILYNGVDDVSAPMTSPAG